MAINVAQRKGGYPDSAFSPFSFVGMKFTKREGVIVEIACL